jgi:nitrous oxide reductase
MTPQLSERRATTMNSEQKSSRMTRREFVTASAVGLAASSFTGTALASASTSQRAARGPFRVIIDTDPGVDDALALLLAMSLP